MVLVGVEREATTAEIEKEKKRLGQNIHAISLPRYDHPEIYHGQSDSRFFNISKKQTASEYVQEAQLKRENGELDHALLILHLGQKDYPNDSAIRNALADYHEKKRWVIVNPQKTFALRPTDALFVISKDPPDFSALLVTASSVVPEITVN